MTNLIDIDTLLDMDVKHTQSNYISFFLVILGTEPRALLLLEQASCHWATALVRNTRQLSQELSNDMKMNQEVLPNYKQQSHKR